MKSKEAKIRSVFKVVRNRDGRLISAMPVDSAFVRCYRKGRWTAGKVLDGRRTALYAFADESTAKDFAHWLGFGDPSIGQVWLAEGREPCRCRQVSLCVSFASFWRARFAGKRFHYIHGPPRGTLECDAIRLIERIE